VLLLLLFKMKVEIFVRTTVLVFVSKDILGRIETEGYRRRDSLMIAVMYSYCFCYMLLLGMLRESI